MTDQSAAEKGFRSLQDDFHEEFMSFNDKRPKYTRRASSEENKRESDKRLEWFPVFEKAANLISAQNGYKPPWLDVRGSVSVEKATPSSDMDIAVIVPLTHPFRSDGQAFVKFQEMLREVTLKDGTKPDFKIDAVFVPARLEDEIRMQRKRKQYPLVSSFHDTPEKTTIIINDKEIKIEDIQFSQDWLDSLSQ